MEVLILNLYFELLKTPVFTVKDVNKYYDNMDSARSAIKRLMKEGMVAKSVTICIPASVERQGRRLLIDFR